MVVVVAVLVVVAVETAPFVLLIKSGFGGAEILLFERGIPARVIKFPAITCFL